MKLIDAEHAKRLAQEHLWGWRRDWIEDVWESPSLTIKKSGRLHELPRSNVLTMTGQSQHNEKTKITYLCPYPTPRKDVPLRF